jgi:hypothetical protein
LISKRTRATNDNQQGAIMPNGRQTFFNATLPTVPRAIVMSTVRRAAVLAVSVLALLAQTHSGWAIPVLDQINDAPTGQVRQAREVHFTDYAQTFTVGLTGTMTSVDVWITRQSQVFTNADLLWDIRSTSFRQPLIDTTFTNVPTNADASALASGSISPNNVPFAPNVGTWMSISLGAGVQVTTGDILALVLRLEDRFIISNTYLWFGVGPNPYSGGEAFGRSTSSADWFPDSFQFPRPNRTDFSFRTFVDTAPVSQVPIPAALPLFATGLAGLGFLARRRNKRTASA